MAAGHVGGEGEGGGGGGQVKLHIKAFSWQNIEVGELSDKIQVHYSSEVHSNWILCQLSRYI